MLPSFRAHFPCFSSGFVPTFRRSMHISGFRAHFPCPIPWMASKPPEKYACFPAFVHTSPVFPSDSSRTTGEVCIYPVFMHTFPAFLPVSSRPSGEVCIYPASVHTFPVQYHGWLQNLWRSMHASQLSCTLPLLFFRFRPDLPEKYAYIRLPCTLPLSNTMDGFKTSGEVCMLPSFRAHFPCISVRFLPNHRRSMHVFRFSCTLPGRAMGVGTASGRSMEP